MRKGLTLVSVLMLILGIVTLATGIMNVALLNAADGGAMGQALIALTVILFIAGGALDVIGGLLGLRAAKRPYKATAAIVFGLLALIAGVVSVVMEQSVQNICGCVIPLVYFVCAVSVKSRSSR